MARAVSRAKTFKGKYEAKLKFPAGWGWRGGEGGTGGGGAEYVFFSWNNVL